MTTGTIVHLKVNCLGNKIGTLGVGFNDYISGCQFIFENGEYDGFSIEKYFEEKQSEQILFLEEIGFDKEISNYKFKNVMQVSQDFRNGFFNSVLNIK